MTGWIATFFTSGPARKALRLLLAAVTIAVYLLNFRRAGERAGQLAEGLSASEKNHDIQRQMSAAAPPIAMLWFSACAIGRGSF